METRCSKVFFPNYSNKNPAEDNIHAFFVLDQLACPKKLETRGVRWWWRKGHPRDALKYTTVRARISLDGQRLADPQPYSRTERQPFAPHWLSAVKGSALYANKLGRGTTYMRA